MPNIIANDCVLTPEIRRMIAEKRHQLGMSYRDLGTYFRLSWSTFRKWESPNRGDIRCRRLHLRLLNAYLDGEFDAALRATRGPVDELVESWKRLPTLVHQCMERITTTYELCRRRPELQQFLVDAVDNASRQALKGLLE